MARTSAERKLLDRIIDAVSDVRFNRYELAGLVTELPKSTRRRVVLLCTAIIEMVAIHWDYGHFEADELDYIKMCRDMREIILSASLDTTDQEG